jgi:hypothetical protein
MNKILAVALMTISFHAIGQYSSAYQTNIVFQSQKQGFLTTLPPRPLNVSGSHYLNEEFYPAEIYLKDSTKLTGIYVRFDLKNQITEIQEDHDVKILHLNRLLAVILESPSGSQQFINGGTVNPDLKNELLQVIAGRNEVKLLAKFYTEYKKGNASQNPMLNGGTSEDQILVRKTFIITKGNNFVDAGKGKAVFREEMIKLFGADIEPQLKKVNPKKEEDLIELISYIDNNASD